MNLDLQYREFAAREYTMKGLILLVFFSLFAVASLLIPLPMFPGYVFCALIGLGASDFVGFLSAVFNGVFYGTILWLVFVAIGRRFKQE